tara:strand:+ start:5720 stop:6340 length:621 start_codon:yes stop_codon:yes gene_type:complete
MDKNKLKFNILKSKQLYDGFCKVFNITFNHQKFNGSTSNVKEHEIFVRSPCVGVLPYNPITNEVILIKQFRIGAIDPLNQFKANFNPWLLEIVAGIIDTNESFEQTGIRECQEEAGCNITKLIPMHDYLVSPGANNERIKLFCGIFTEKYIPGIFGLDFENEDIKTYLMSLDKAEDLLNSGKICNAASIVALQWIIINKKKILDLQ